MPKRAKKVKRSSVHRSLVHHSHSGRLVHRRHTHYPIVIFLMLLTGVLLFAMTAVTRAADIQVRATVLGQPPPYAAAITKPVNGQRFSSIPIDVEGTCPPSSVVKIYRNDVFSGSALCSATNDFALQIDLFEGKNTLVARVFNYAEVEGPESDPVEVYYDKPVQAPPKPVPGSKTPIAQLFLDTGTLYRGFLVGEEITWPAEIGGGVPPYALSVDWGDGSSDVISLSKAGKFDLKHTYATTGGYKGSYIVILKASDSQGGKAYLQFVIVVNDKKNATSTFTTGDDEDLLGFWQNLYNKFLLMWPLYLVALLMLFSFWLGERREFNLLTRNRRTRRAH
jgi:hypothetical protein